MNLISQEKLNFILIVGDGAGAQEPLILQRRGDE
jgi:hypothetical protein